MRRLSYKSVAKYATGTASQKRDILEQYLHPSEDAIAGAANYYRPALGIISRYHQDKHNVSWLEREAKKMDIQASEETGYWLYKYRSNARNIRDYGKRFESERWEILENHKYQFTVSDVVVSVNPDMHVRRNHKDAIIQLGFTAKKPRDRCVDIMTTCILNAVISCGTPLPPSSILHFDISRGDLDHAGDGLWTNRIIRDTCAEMSTKLDELEAVEAGKTRIFHAISASMPSSIAPRIRGIRIKGTSLVTH